MELLAPCGNKEALYQAIAGGADAVYLGYTAFSARQGAGNFTREELIDAVALCHLHHVRVHVTVNTLVKEAEMDALLDALHIIAGAGADAVLVQDIGVARLIQTHFKTLPIHASTQMALHNAQGVRFAKKMGFKRVVMARECTLSEIKKACREDMEIEVFVHGAMCVSQSGQCLFSSMIGGRSGNRGRCAQPCRLNYTFEKKSGAFLSPRDIMLREQLPLLRDAGVASVKIEGRLKRPEYVAAVTQSYRRALDGASWPADMERDALLQMFNRGNFMRGHLMLDEDADICYPDRVGHNGVPIGKVEGFHRGMARIVLTGSLNDGDALQFRGERDTDAVYAGKPMEAGQTALCRLREDAVVTLGSTVHRLTDRVQMEAVLKKELPPIPVAMGLTVMPNQPMTLNVSSVTVSGDVAQAAQKAPLSHETLEQIMRKTGGTGFVATEVDVVSENAFAPVSALNRLRRDGLNAYAAARCRAFYEQGQLKTPPPVLPNMQPPHVGYPKAVRASDPRFFAPDTLNLFEPLSYDSEMLDGITAPVWLCLPSMCETATLDLIVAIAHENRDKVSGLVLGSMGQFGIETDLPIAASEGIPAFNRLAAQTLVDLGCRFIIASPELTKNELSLLAGYPLIVPTYGRTRLMVLSHCPRRTHMGLKKGRRGCQMCETAPLPPLVDRMNVAFPLQRVRLPEGCRISVLNSVPINNLAHEASLGFPVLHTFTTERAIAYESGTHGHLLKPVE